jgi:hypothetical protein
MDVKEHIFVELNKKNTNKKTCHQEQKKVERNENEKK